jgi:hypothetical protein
LPFRAAYRVGAGVTAAEGDGAGELPITIGRFAHAESPVSNVTNASPSTTDFSPVFIAVLLLSVNSCSSYANALSFRAMRFCRISSARAVPASQTVSESMA